MEAASRSASPFTDSSLEKSTEVDNSQVGEDGETKQVSQNGENDAHDVRQGENELASHTISPSLSRSSCDGSPPPRSPSPATSRANSVSRRSVSRSQHSLSVSRSLSRSASLRDRSHTPSASSQSEGDIGRSQDVGGVTTEAAEQSESPGQGTDSSASANRSRSRSRSRSLSSSSSSISTISSLRSDSSTNAARATEQAIDKHIFGTKQEAAEHTNNNKDAVNREAHATRQWDWEYAQQTFAAPTASWAERLRQHVRRLTNEDNRSSGAVSHSSADINAAESAGVTGGTKTNSLSTKQVGSVFRRPRTAFGRRILVNPLVKERFLGHSERRVLEQPDTNVDNSIHQLYKRLKNVGEIPLSIQSMDREREKFNHWKRIWLWSNDSESNCATSRLKILVKKAQEETAKENDVSVSKEQKQERDVKPEKVPRLDVREGLRCFRMHSARPASTASNKSVQTASSERASTKHESCRSCNKQLHTEFDHDIRNYVATIKHPQRKRKNMTSAAAANPTNDNEEDANEAAEATPAEHDSSVTKQSSYKTLQLFQSYESFIQFQVSRRKLLYNWDDVYPPPRDPMYIQNELEAKIEHEEHAGKTSSKEEDEPQNRACFGFYSSQPRTDQKDDKTDVGDTILWKTGRSLDAGGPQPRQQKGRKSHLLELKAGLVQIRVPQRSGKREKRSSRPSSPLGGRDQETSKSTSTADGVRDTTLVIRPRKKYVVPTDSRRNKFIRNRINQNNRGAEEEKSQVAANESTKQV